MAQIKMVEAQADFVFILKEELTESPDGLEVKFERKMSQT